MKVIEYLEGRYTAQEEPFGVAYKWSPEHVVIECKCGQGRPSRPPGAPAAAAAWTMRLSPGES